MKCENEMQIKFQKQHLQKLIGRQVQLKDKNKEMEDDWNLIFGHMDAINKEKMNWLVNTTKHALQGEMKINP